MKIKKVFITGGAGYIGSVTAEELLKKGIEVVIYDNLSTGHKDAIPKEASFIKGDLEDYDLIRKSLKNEKPQAVIHFAGNALVGESMEKPEKYFKNNVGNGINLLNAMVEADIKKIIFSSTCAIFGIPKTLPIKEDAPKNPTNPYGESKLIFEQILKWYNKIHRLNFISLRYFNAAGASLNYGEDHNPETHLIPIVLDVALGKREYIEIFGNDYDTFDGTCIRDYIHIIDLANAHILALESDIESDFFNMGNGKGYSVLEIIEAVKKVTGKEIKTIFGKRREGDPPALIGSSEKIKKVLKWSPIYHDIESIVKSAWEWKLKFPDGYFL